MNNHTNIKLSADGTKRYLDNIPTTRVEGISESLDGSLDNYNGIKVGDTTSFEGIDGQWKLESAKPEGGKTNFHFKANS